MPRRWTIHLLLLALVATAVGVLFLREPGFGDDLTYWSFAFDLHERGLRAWSQTSFHDLRWPVWGVCWLIQSVSGPGLLSYYGEPILYLIAGALVSFAFGRYLSDTPRLGWACALAFLFHPLLDTVCHRPMPDLSEGVWGAIAMLCWWRMIHCRTRSSSAAWAVLLGLIVFLTESNRLTGVFIAAVLAICTLAFARASFRWLLLTGAVAAVCYVGEAAFYHGLFHDWLHNLHANLGAKGRKGTESIPLLTLPFRFIDSLVKETRLSWLYALCALLGLGWAWRFGQPRGYTLDQADTAAPKPLGRVIVVWFVSLYLLIACAPQSVWPWRPVVRDAERFLAALAVPMSVLAACGLAWLLELAQARNRRWGRWIYDRPVLAGGVAAVLLALLGARPFFNLGSVPEMRRYLRSLPTGTKVFTHSAMRQFVYLVDAATAPRFEWHAKNDIINATPELEKLAAQCSEFWYARKLVWLNARKQLERKNVSEQKPLPTYFDHPERDWKLARLLAKGDTPDLVFYRRRTPETPMPVTLGPDAPQWAAQVPALPFEWNAATGKRIEQVIWKIPPELRGKSVRLEIEAASAQVQGVAINLIFSQSSPHPTALERLEKVAEKLHLSDARQHQTEYVLKPYLHPTGGKEFFVLSLPPADDECTLQFKFSKDAKTVRFTNFRADFEDQLAGAGE